jgi:hypothetical protein
MKWYELDCNDLLGDDRILYEATAVANEFTDYRAIAGVFIPESLGCYVVTAVIGARFDCD